MLASHDWDVDASPRLLDARTARFVCDHRALRRGLDAAISSRHNLFALGADPLIEQLMSAAGFNSLDYVATRCLVSGKRITIVALTTRIWSDPDARSDAMSVKVQAGIERTRVILIPQRSVVGSNRGRNAALIAKGRSIALSSNDIDVVMSHVRSARITTTAACIMALPGRQDPLGIVLAMIARGFLDADRSKPIDATTWIVGSI